MHKTLHLALLLLLTAPGLNAQESKPQASTGQSTGKTSGLVTLEGCLQSSNGHFDLTERDGTAHHLTGAANKLSHFVSHEIEVTGTPSIETIDTSEPGMASGAVERAVFRVKSFKELAKTCESTP